MDLDPEQLKGDRRGCSSTWERSSRRVLAEAEMGNEFLSKAVASRTGDTSDASVVKVFASSHVDDIVVGEAKPPSELNECETYSILGGRSYFTLVSALF